MITCTWTKKIDAWLDGELTETATVQAHLEDCPACARHHALALQMREAVQALPTAPEVADGQFSAFLEGIERGIEAPRKGPGNFWALASLTAAALVIAVATFSLFTGPGPVKANEVESISTQLDNATVHWDNSDDGVTTIWISIAEDDV
jgi:anti-sigma factor RsiW